MTHLVHLKVVVLSLFCSLGLASCMVGPNFKAPAAPTTQSYTANPMPKKTISTAAAGQSGKSQQFMIGQDISGEWWTLFQSPEINSLIQQGLVNSPNLETALATLRQAQENLKAQIATSLFPSVNGQLGAQRQQFSPSEFGVGGLTPSVFNLYNASVNVSYTLDIFGGARRQIEELAAQVDYQRYEVEAAYLTLTSNIVTTAITYSSQLAQIKATRELIASQAGQLKIVKQQFELGGTSRADVLSQETQLEQTRATLPPLETNAAQSRHALAVLIGVLPSDVKIPAINLNKLHLPTKLPVSIPSNLVRQRPDIQAAEALLHAANAQVGVATANFFPQITLTGSYGGQSNTLGNVFQPTGAVWNVGGQLLQPLFTAGALTAQRRAAIAAYQQAGAQYRQTVLVAFQNVADTLRALENDAKTLQAQTQGEVAARESLHLTEEQFKLGGVNYVSLLIAERQYQEAKIKRIQAQATRYSDTAALFQALGGGWWNRKTDLNVNKPKTKLESSFVLPIW